MENGSNITKSRQMMIGLMVFLVACGTGGEGDIADDAAGADDPSGSAKNGDEVDSEAASGVSEGAMPTLTIDGETFTFQATPQSTCELGSQPTDVEAYFGDGDPILADSGTADFEYVIFNIVVDNVFIRARAGGEERTHTAGTDDMALDVRSDGFSYSHEGVSLDVIC